MCINFYKKVELNNSEEDTVGYAVYFPNEVYNGEQFSNLTSISAGENDNGWVIGVRFQVDDFISYNVFVSSGHTVRKGWAIFLAILGGIVIAILLVVGCFGYFVKKRKRSLIGSDDGYGTLDPESEY